MALEIIQLRFRKVVKFSNALTLSLLFILVAAAAKLSAQESTDTVDIKWLKNKRAAVFNLGPTVNTAFSEYNPVIGPEMKFMLFTSRSDTTTGQKVDEVDQEHYEDIMVANMGKNNFENAKRIDKVGLFKTGVNTVKHEAPVFISSSGQTVVIYKENALWYAVKTDTGYSAFMKYSKNINFKYYHRHASITADGKNMYFTVEVVDKESGRINFDIFKSTLNANNEWESPEPLPAPINTAFDEDSPEISADGKNLFFSSQREDGYGGYDVYVADFQADSLVVELLPPPINSAATDIYFKMAPDGLSAYISSNRLGGYGLMDIYKIAFDQPKFTNCNPYEKNSKSIRITGNDTVLFGTAVALDASNSTVGGLKAQFFQWTAEQKMITKKSSFKYAFGKPAQFQVGLYVSAIDSQLMNFVHECVTQKVNVLDPIAYKKLVLPDPNKPKVRAYMTDNEVRSMISEGSGAFKMKGDFASTFVDSPVEINLFANDPTFSQVGGLTLVKLGRPASGMASIKNAKNGVIYYAPSKGFQGVDMFPCTAKDANGKLGEAWVVVRVYNLTEMYKGAVAINDEVKTDAASPVDIQLLKNDAVGLGANYELVKASEPTFGAIDTVNREKGSVTYDPDTSFIGTDKFTYTIKNSDGKQQSAVVSVKVGDAENMEEMSRPDLIKADMNSISSFNVLLNDPASDRYETKILSISNPSNGLAQVFNPDEGIIIYSPKRDFRGFESFTYTAMADDKMYVESVSISVSPEDLILASAQEVAADRALQKKEEKELAMAEKIAAKKTDVTKVTQIPVKGYEAALVNVDTTVKPNVALASIYFDFDSYAIRTTQRQVMDQNVELLKANPSAVVQIVSHCDSRGHRAYNKLLSNRRAKATATYLTKNGIDQNRIIAYVGMGESKLINDCGDGKPCPNSEHAKNRRSDLIVVGTLK